jgi:hypothetical protein
MKMQHLLGLCAALILSCQADSGQQSFVEQEKRVETAARDLSVERRRLQGLRDSLDIKIKADLELGMTEETAKSVETSLIEVQETVVKATEIYLTHKREVLALMKAANP